MISSKYLVLNQILKSDEGYISGQEIAGRLGISRTAVNKAVISLRAEGYGIEAVNKMGYRITYDPNLINYGELLGCFSEDRLSKIAIYDSVVSTNVMLHELAEKGAENGQVVIASSQSSGRGRKGSSFASPDNKSIYLSYLIIPERQISIKKVTPTAAEAVAENLSEIAGLEGEIKVEYPGDVYLAGNKVCGILSEVLMEAESSYIRYLMVGIGIRPVKGMKRAGFAAKLIKKLDSDLMRSV